MKEQARARNALASKSGREIGPLPEIVDPARRESCRPDLRKFCETYLSDWFYWDWSPDHLVVLNLLQTTVLIGGQFAVAMPRGFGKSALCKAGTIWAMVYGHRKFIVPIGATAEHGADLVMPIKTELETNELLIADFPEVCYPIVRLEAIANRAKGQTLNGSRTNITWTDDEIVLPTVAGSAASNTIVRSFGLTGAIRGTSYTGGTDGIRRPDLVLLDDPQTDESAKSPIQNRDRMRLIKGAVLGLAGKKKKIAVLMPTTVIFPNDMSDQFLDRNKHPEWQGQRFKMLYAFPANKELWRQYAEIRRDSLKAGNKGREATEFYAANREAMDAGAIAAWPQCFYEHDELSAVQNAMNFLIDNPDAFAAEGQGEPKKEEVLEDVKQLEEADLQLKLNNLHRGIVPRDCNKLTAFVDVQAEILFWAVCAWDDKFGGSIVDYGTFPAQPTSMFTAANPDVKLSNVFPQYERKARIYAALAEVVPSVMGRSFRQDGADGSLNVSQMLIDIGFETDSVHDFIARSPLRAVLKASKGRGVGPSAKPMNEYRKDPGDMMGWNWRIDARSLGKGRFVSFDANEWKSKMAEAILAAPGASGSFYLPGEALHEHPLLVLHLLAEYRTPTKNMTSGRRVEEWRARPGQRENHWWDAIIGCGVAASIIGVAVSPAAAVTGKPDPLEPLRPKATREDYEKKRREFETRRR